MSDEDRANFLSRFQPALESLSAEILKKLQFKYNQSQVLREWWSSNLQFLVGYCLQIWVHCTILKKDAPMNLSIRRTQKEFPSFVRQIGFEDFLNIFHARLIQDILSWFVDLLSF